MKCKVLFSAIKIHLNMRVCLILNETVGSGLASKCTTALRTLQTTEDAD